MANYSVTYACGHTLDKQLFGKHADRQRYIAWAAKSGTCRACADQADANVASEIEAAHNLPVLIGSDKQIAWARKIRAEKIESILDFFRKTEPKILSSKKEEFEEKCSYLLERVASKNSAGYWIDARDQIVEDFLWRQVTAT